MAKVLERIDGPGDVKKLTLEQMEELAGEIREELITVLSKNGGHLGPNLGVVELSIAMHHVFSTPDDNFIFDVSHQAYVHKLLTGRRKQFNTIRTPGGLNGFMVRAESPHDCYGAGHAGTALSAALGMAVGRDLRQSDEHVVALAGDAAFTCGVSFEALNNVAHQTKRLIIILNDNEWSIDKNVGAIANYLNKIVTSESYSHLHDQAKRLLERLGGKTAVHVARKAEEAVKSLMGPSLIFEELGLEYYGPVDGHNLEGLVHTLEFLKSQDHPVLLHVLTKKGRGFEPAIASQKKFHGTGPFDPETGATKASGQPTYSHVFADSLASLADKHKDIVAITGGMPNGTALDRFQPKHPDRYFDVGIAEEHAVLFACGLATKGLKPFCAIYSTFLQRSYDMIIHDVCLQNLPVVFCMDRGGLSPDDGPTHHGLFDISYMRCVPNIVHMVPKDEDELADMLLTAYEHQGPIAVRYPRGTGPGKALKAEPVAIPIGKAEQLREGDQVSIWAIGAMVPEAEALADKLAEQGISASVINARFTKPIDVGLLEKTAKGVHLVVTLEDHVLKGGFGSAILEELADLNLHPPVVRVGWPDQFIEHGKQESLRDEHGLTANRAWEKIQPYLGPLLDDKKASAAKAIA